MLILTKKIAIVAALSLSVAACSSNEIGTELDEGGFGNPTMNNNLVNTGQITVAHGLNIRFANEVPSTINFGFNSATLDDTARAALLQQASFIKQFPEVRFRVYGHTDLVGSQAYNRSLGLRRARAAVAFLTRQGISRSRLEAVSTFGETRPVIVTEARERRNRRTVTEVSGFVGGEGRGLDGKYAALVYRKYVSTGSDTGVGQTVRTGIADGVGG